MPGLHGRALAEALRHDRPTLRVLFMSGYTEDEVLHRGISTEALAFIAKPFTPAALAARVRAVLDADPGPVGGDGDGERDDGVMAGALATALVSAER